MSDPVRAKAIASQLRWLAGCIENQTAISFVVTWDGQGGVIDGEIVVNLKRNLAAMAANQAQSEPEPAAPEIVDQDDGKLN